MMLMMMLQCTAARELVEVELSVSLTPVSFWLRPGFSLTWPWYFYHLYPTYHNPNHLTLVLIIFILLIITITPPMSSSNLWRPLGPRAWGSLEVLGGHVQIVGDERIRMLVQVLETLLEMRTQRMGLIQTEDQLRFSVEALILALKRLQGEEVSWPFVV